MKRVIEEKDLIELLTGYYKYMALESYGVDNWELYGDSLWQYLEENECKGYEELANKDIDVWAQTNPLI